MKNLAEPSGPGGGLDDLWENLILDSLPLFLHKKDGEQLTKEEIKKFIEKMKKLLDK
jgi:hypothetical protein